jgi:D-serine deaminase-like pyridoxal phosphate-dependent protein
VLIEVDTDGHRSGIRPEEDALLDVARVLHDGGMRLGGVMTHAGSSYDFDTPEALRAMAEQERAGCVRAAQRLRDAGLPCPVVSVGSTPTALMAERAGRRDRGARGRVCVLRPGDAQRGRVQ